MRQKQQCKEREGRSGRLTPNIKSNVDQHNPQVLYKARVCWTCRHACSNTLLKETINNNSMSKFLFSLYTHLFIIRQEDHVTKGKK